MGTEAAVKKKVLKIVETETGRLVHEVDVSTKSAAMIERVMLGMLRNMDTDKFHIDDTGAA